MKKTKEEAKEQINEFFSSIKGKNPKQIKKIKRLAMRNSIKLGKLRKKFCKKCLSPYINPKVRIKNKMKIIICKNCGHKSRWKVKN